MEIRLDGIEDIGLAMMVRSWDRVRCVLARKEPVEEIDLFRHVSATRRLWAERDSLPREIVEVMANDKSAVGRLGRYPV